MPKNKPKYKKAGTRPAAGAPAAEKDKKQPKGAAKGKTAALNKGSASATAGARGQAAADTAKTGPARRLRFVPPAAAKACPNLAAGPASPGRGCWSACVRAPAQSPVRGRTGWPDHSCREGHQRPAACNRQRPGHLLPRLARQASMAYCQVRQGVLPLARHGLLSSPGRALHDALLRCCCCTGCHESWICSKAPAVVAGARTCPEQALTFDGLMAMLLAIMLFYPPFFRGLFFENELLPTHMLTAAVFALFAFYKLERRELVFFERPLDYAVFILLGLYVTSSINAWSVRDAIRPC